jgi:hypothetical protein
MKATIFAPTLWTEMTDDMSETVNGGGSHCYEKKEKRHEHDDYCGHKKEHKHDDNCEHSYKKYDYKQYFVSIWRTKSC